MRAFPANTVLAVQHTSSERLISHGCTFALEVERLLLPFMQAQILVTASIHIYVVQNDVTARIFKGIIGFTYCF
jgi:hypothetical protein